MRKAFLLISILIVTSNLLFADSNNSTAEMEITAYKQASTTSNQLTSVKTTLYDGSTELQGIVNKPYTIKDETVDMLGSDYIFDKDYAFSITISSRSKNPTIVTLKLSPFVNVNDSSKTIPVTYIYSSADPNKIYYPDSSSNPASQGSTYYRYLYIPKIIFTGGSTVSVNETTLVTLTHELDLENSNYITYSRTGRFFYTYTEINRTSLESVPTSGNTIRGLSSDSDNLVTTSKFNIKVSENDYAKMAANTDYLATVTLTISAN